MATLGNPALTPLRVSERVDRDLAIRIDVIRQRLGALDAEVIRLGSVADASTTAQSVLNLQRALLQLTQRVSAIEAQLGATDTIILAASSTVSKFDALYVSGPSRVARVDPTDPLMIHTVIGIALNDGAEGTPITVQRGGPLALPTSALVTGEAIYIATDGTLTQDPSAATYSIPIGVATSGSTIWVGAGFAAVQLPTLEPTDAFMPITYGLAQALIDDAQGGDIVLYDNEGRAAIASDGGAIIKASGA